MLGRTISFMGGADTRAQNRDRRSHWTTRSVRQPLPGTRRVPCTWGMEGAVVVTMRVTQDVVRCEQVPGQGQTQHADILPGDGDHRQHTQKARVACGLCFDHSHSQLLCSNSTVDHG